MQINYYEVHNHRVINGEGMTATVDTPLRELAMDTRVGTVLDLGAGYGRVGETIIDADPSVVVTSLELDRKLVERGRSTAPWLNFIQGSVTELPFREQSFDAITAVNVFHEAAGEGTTAQERAHSFAQGASEIARVLNLNGKVVLFDGCMPKDEGRQITLRACSNKAGQLLDKFGREYHAREPQISYSQNGYQTDLATVATLVTKLAYLEDSSTWEGERKQIYPFIDLASMTQIFGANKLVIEDINHPLPSERLGLAKLFDLFEVNMEGQDLSPQTFPYTQSLIIARKTGGNGASAEWALPARP